MQPLQEWLCGELCPLDPTAPSSDPSFLISFGSFQSPDSRALFLGTARFTGRSQPSGDRRIIRHGAPFMISSTLWDPQQLLSEPFPFLTPSECPSQRPVYNSSCPVPSASSISGASSPKTCPEIAFASRMVISMASTVEA